MEIRQIRTFIAIAEAGSITAASRALFTTQPALTRQLAQLERAAGVRLFERSHVGVIPTAEGHALLLRARRVIAEFEALVHSERSAAGTARHTALRVGILDEGLGRYITSVLHGFHQAHPTCELVLVPLQRRTDAHPLQRNHDALDLVIGDDPPPEDEGYERVVLYRQARVAAVAAHSGLAAAAALTVEDLESATFAHVEGLTTGMRRIVHLEDERGGPARTGRVACRPEIADVLARIGRSGEVMTFGDDIRRFYSHPAVAFRPLAGVPPVPKLICWRTASKHPAAESFVRLATAACS